MQQALSTLKTSILYKLDPLVSVDRDYLCEAGILPASQGGCYIRRMMPDLYG